MYYPVLIICYPSRFRSLPRFGCPRDSSSPPPRTTTVIRIMPAPTTIGALVVIALCALCAVSAFAPAAATASSSAAPSSSLLHAANDSPAATCKENRKLSIETVVDENLDDILGGPRPVLVDGKFAQVKFEYLLILSTTNDFFTCSFFALHSVCTLVVGSQ